MKVYLAARYSTKLQILGYAQELRDLGIEVTSRWLEELHSQSEWSVELTEDINTGYADDDLEDVERADWLVFFSVDPLIPVVRGGRHVEFGYALRAGKQVLVVGPKENIFHYLRRVNIVNDWEEAKNFLSARNAE